MIHNFRGNEASHHVINGPARHKLVLYTQICVYHESPMSGSLESYRRHTQFRTRQTTDFACVNQEQDSAGRRRKQATELRQSFYPVLEERNPVRLLDSPPAGLAEMDEGKVSGLARVENASVKFRPPDIGTVST